MEIYSQLNIDHIVYEPKVFDSEAQMEGYILMHEDVLRLDDKGLSSPVVIGNQLNVPNAKVNGANGRLDILVAYSATLFGIVELKRGKIDLSALSQLDQYLQFAPNSPDVMNAISRYIRPQTYNPQSFELIGILIGYSADQQLCHAVRTNKTGTVYKSKKDLYGLTLRRYETTKSGSHFVITDRVFQTNQGKCHFSYSFNRKIYNASNLPLAVIMEYVARSPNCGIQQLLKDLRLTQSALKSNQGKSGIPNGRFHKYSTVCVSGVQYYVSYNWANKQLEDMVDASESLFQSGKLPSEIIVL